MKLSLSQSDEPPSWLRSSDVDALARLLDTVEPRERSLNLVVVDDAYIRRLNKRYRSVDRATDVLSFSFIDDVPDPGDPDDPAGEVYVSRETVFSDAAELSVDPSRLFLRIGLHGALHVIGHDHEHTDDALAMESEEARLLGTVLESDEMRAFFGEEFA